MENNNIKVAYLLGSLNRGGTETLMLDIIKAKKLNFSYIAIHRKDGVLKDDFYSSTHKILHLPKKSLLNFSYFLRLRKLLKEEKIGIVHAHQYIDAFYGYFACLGTNIKVIQTIHGYNDLSIKRKNPILNFITKKTQANIFVSQSQKKHYQEKYKLNLERQFVIYNGVDFEKFCQDHNSTEFKVKSDSTLLLGSVGNFVKVRNQLVICKFLNLLKKNNINFKFIFIGAKSLTEPWLYDDCVRYCSQNNLTDNVHFLGSRKDVFNLLNQMDAFIYSSEHDTFGIAVIEAISSKTPVFVNDWEVMKEITCNGQLAILYKSNNETDLLNKFMDFLENQEKYQKEAESFAKEVINLYSIEKHINNLENLYNRLILEAEC